MEIELNDAHFSALLVTIHEKLSKAEDPQFGHSVAAVAGFATKLITSVVISVSDNREDALEGVHSALFDCKSIINKAYDVLDAFKAAADGKVH
jgi:hypothetical protein